MKRQMPEHRVTNYIGVKSVDEYSSKVEKLGGKVIAHKHVVLGMGYFVLCIDTENNAFAIFSASICFCSKFGKLNREETAGDST